MKTEKTIPLSNPDITDAERQAVLEVLNTPHLSLGPKIPAFETLAAQFAGVKYAVAMSSGTAVLHTIIRALAIGPGDYVLTTPFSFISTANCLLYEGAKPLFVDITEETYNLSPDRVRDYYLSLPGEKRARVKAILYVDVFGVPADGESFEALGREFGLAVIDDAAEALGSTFKGRPCGSFGDCGLYAFYPNKQVTTGEGGMLLTGRPEIAGLAASLRNQGRDEGAGWLQHARLGYNYRLSDIHAALGSAQMTRIDELLAKRRRVKETYDRYLQEVFARGLLIPQQALPGSRVSPFVYVVRLNDSFTREERDRLLRFLREKGIQCANYFTPIHLQPHFRDLGWHVGDMPITEKVAARTVALPFFNNLAEPDIAFIAATLHAWFSSSCLPIS